MRLKYARQLGNRRLKQIKNLDPSSAVISQFDYTYNPVGDILAWTQANAGATNPKRHDFGYDTSNQLRAASLTDTVTQASLHQYDYDYDAVGNRKVEQVDGAVTTSVANNLNQLTSRSAGGKMHFRGTVNEPATVTVGGNPASVDAVGNFDGTVNVNVGTNTVAVVATDASGNSRTNNYQITMPSGVNTTFLYDLNGNLTNDGMKTYEWDAADRCLAINAGTHRTEMSYDGRNRETRRVEKENGTVTKTSQFIWEAWDRCEERDADNQATKRFYAGGEQISGSAYFFSRDHLGSIDELTDSNGAVRARYDYDPYGVRTRLSGDLSSDFGFSGYYVSNQYSDLAFAPLRIYGLELGRWLSRDPIGEEGGINLYGYVGNNPIYWVDPLGLDQTIWTPGPGRSWSDGPRNGEWGGRNWSGGLSPTMQGPPAPPTDSADALYKAHDDAYGNAKCPNDIKAANKDLVNGLKNLPSDPRKWSNPPRSGTERDSANFRDMAIFFFSHR